MENEETETGEEEGSPYGDKILCIKTLKTLLENSYSW